MNKESIRKHHLLQREKISKEIHDSSVPLTVHWDEKILPELPSKESVNRLAVLILG